MGPLVKNYEEQYLGYATGFASLQGAELKVWGGVLLTVTMCMCRRHVSQTFLKL